MTSIYLFFSTIPLLGYLPQEMVGVSIFDFYHNDDLGILYNIYKQGNCSAFSKFTLIICII